MPGGYREAIEYANKKRYAEGKNLILQVWEPHWCGSIIDSHCFNVRRFSVHILDENGIAQITKDHSLVEILVSRAKLQ